MSETLRNRNFIKSTGQEITKMEREQVDTDERGDPVYQYTEAEESIVFAITSGKAGNPSERSAGESASEKRMVLISDEIDWTSHTRFRLEEGFEYSIQQPKPAKTGMRKLTLERVVE